jgi:hypothetical protein
VFLHLPVEDVFDWMAGRFGFDTYERVAFWTFLSMGVVLLAAAWSCRASGECSLAVR